MVRTKAEASTRVAAGAKASKKMTHRVIHSPSPSPTGKDNFPVNRYCPRETPTWQKKITCFYQQKSDNESSLENDETPEENMNTADDNKRSSKRTSNELDTTDEEKPTSKRFKAQNNMEIDSEQVAACENNNQNESLEMEE